MSLSIVQLFERLEQDITPKVLPGIASTDNRAVALSQFYPILLTMFMNRSSDLPPSTMQASGSHIMEQLWPDANHRNQVMEQLALHNNVEQADMARIMSDATPQVASFLSREAGSQGVHGYLTGHREGIIKRLPAWTEKLLPLLGLAAAPATMGATSTATHHHTQPAVVTEPRSGMGKWLPLLALLTLGLLALLFWKTCSNTTQTTQTTTAAPVATQQTTTTTTTTNAATTPAYLSMSTGTGDRIYACRSYVGDETLKTKIQGIISQVFNGGQCAIMADQAYATTLPGDDKLAEVLTLVRNVPDATIEINGKDVTVNAPNAAQLTDMVNKIKAIWPDMNVVAAAPLNITQSVTQSIERATTALTGMDATTARPADVARALNLQIINFAVDSDVIPEENKPVLNKAAELIKQVPNVHLVVEGHTDSTGNHAYNMALSQRRAQSVKNYLESQGVQGDKLSVKGYGPDKPVADNATELGRFRNRRIEFVVENTTSGTVRAVNESTTAGTPAVVTTQTTETTTAPATTPVATDTTAVNPAPVTTDGTTTTVTSS